MIESVDPIPVLVTLSILSMAIRGIVQALKRQFPAVSGGWTQLAAVVLGLLTAVSLDLLGTGPLLTVLGATAANTPPVIVDYLITGAVLGLGAGYLADIVKKP